VVGFCYDGLMGKILLGIFLLLLWPRRCAAAIEASFSGLPKKIGVQEEFSFHFQLTGAPLGKIYYLRCGFQKEAGSRYFGETFNPEKNQWVNSEADFSEFLKITTGGEGEWEGEVKCRVDSSETGFAGEGEYLFKICRYTEGGTANWYDSGETITISFLPSPTLTPTPTPSSFPSPTPTPFAQWKINEAKDTNGTVLSAVKIYLDDVYLHHYSPEVLTFCSGCQCGEVECDFGIHRLRLVKSGYLAWEEEREVKPGEVVESNPVLEKEAAPTVSPSPSPSPSPTPSVTPSPLPSPSPQISSSSAVVSFSPVVSPQVLGETAKTTSSSGERKRERSKGAKAGLLLSLGGGLLIIAGWPRRKPKDFLVE